ncbi:PIF1 helicase-like protein [Trypanosoma grayi]|uniref:PIF1 helicase-like protein n=1 Tax=Trypanosoma grayi TaxID=71804 RepID=UPI0004F487A8|nr:PIF1 helicase-like protein [Trypanosoma grayi]KEG08854.1 PIF1 helicase-like protein [Trypanosoma grayi]
MATLKPKMTVAAVRGRIIVMSEDGERIGAWGGTECFLSRQTGLGPCLVVRSSRHRRHEGTFFQLTGLQRVLATYATEGKLTVVMPHERRVCSVFIETTADVDALRIMAAVLQDRSHWKEIEKNVACKKGREARASGAKGGDLRDPNALGMPDWNNNDDDDDQENSGDEIDHQSTERTVEAAAAETEGLPPAAPSIRGGAPVAPSPTTAVSSWGAGRSDAVEAAPHGMLWAADQLRAIQLIRAGRSVFVTGSAGTGKTAWLLHVVDRVLTRGEGTVVTATTGAAARLLRGCTLHSFAGIGKGEGTLEKVLHRVKSRPEVVRAWRSCETLIIDEIGVLPAAVFAVLDEVARCVRKVPEKPFGGIQLVLLGDFLQLPPVVARATNAGGSGQTPKWCFESPLWDKLQLVSIEFRKNYRQEGDPAFEACMEDIRYGRYTRRVERLMSACLSNRLGERYGVEPTMIMARRQDAAAYNTERLQQLDNVDFHRYASEDYASTPGTDLDKEVSLPPLLELRVGAQVVLLASLPDAPHLSNGDLGVVVSFLEQAHGPALPVVCFASSSGEEVVVPRVRMEVLSADGLIAASRLQVPLQLAWALTVHRVQGMTLPMVRVKLDASFFECGQAYVALTRARRQDDVAITRFDPSAIRADARVVAFYEKLFPRGRQQQNDADSELVEAQRGGKRQRSPPAVLHGDSSSNGKSTQWTDEQLFDSQLEDRMSLAVPPQPVTRSALRLFAATNSLIPQLTQESETADSTQPLQLPVSQRTLLMDDE